MKKILNIKKILALICISVLIINLFSACIVFEPLRVRFDTQENKDNIVKVELINYNNPEIKIIKDVKDGAPFDFDKMQVLEEVEESKLESIIEEIFKITVFDYSEYKEFEDSAAGVCIKVTYLNDDFIILSSHHIDEKYTSVIAKYDAEGQVKELIGTFGRPLEYVEIVNNYFDTEIE